GNGLVDGCRSATGAAALAGIESGFRHADIGTPCVVRLEGVGLARDVEKAEYFTARDSSRRASLCVEPCVQRRFINADAHGNRKSLAVLVYGLIENTDVDDVFVEVCQDVLLGELV